MPSALPTSLSCIHLLPSALCFYRLRPLERGRRAPPTSRPVLLLWVLLAPRRSQGKQKAHALDPEFPEKEDSVGLQLVRAGAPSSRENAQPPFTRTQQSRLAAAHHLFRAPPVGACVQRGRTAVDDGEPDGACERQSGVPHRGAAPRAVRAQGKVRVPREHDRAEPADGGGGHRAAGVVRRAVCAAAGPVADVQGAWRRREPGWSNNLFAEVSRVL